MVRVDGEPGLLVDGRLRPWSFNGYGAPAAVSVPEVVEVLTPPSTVAAIAAGYRPLVHPSALPPGAAGRGLDRSTEPPSPRPG
jgi:hypothetical protein